MDKIDKEYTDYTVTIRESGGETISNTSEFVFSARYTRPLDKEGKTVFVSYD